MALSPAAACRFPSSMNRVPPVPVVEAVRVTESAPRPNRMDRCPSAAGTGSDQNPRPPRTCWKCPATESWLKATMASAATCRDPSAGETAVETNTVPSGNGSTSAGNPSTILPWAEAAAGKGRLTRGAGGEGTGNPEGVRAHGRKDFAAHGCRGRAVSASRRSGAGCAVAGPPPAAAARLPDPAALEPAAVGLLPAGGASARRRGLCCRHLVQHDGGASQERRHADPRDDQPLGFHRLSPARAKRIH